MRVDEIHPVVLLCSAIVMVTAGQIMVEPRSVLEKLAFIIIAFSVSLVGLAFEFTRIKTEGDTHSEV